MSCSCGCGGTLPCGCCESVEILTPATLGNRPGLDAIEYRVGTHGTFLESMKARLSGSKWLDQLKTRESSDPAIAFLDAWAIVGDVLTFHQERIANEGYLRTATERRSVLQLAELVGYTLRPGVSASAYLAYTLDKPIAVPALLEKPQLAPPPPDPLVTIPQGSRAQSIPGPGELPQSFETSDDLTARFAWNDLQVRLNRPQKIDADTRVIYLKGVVNLKPGDPLLIIASPPTLYRIESVTPDAAANRTKVTFRPWVEVQLPPEPSAVLLEEVADVVTKFSAVERFGVARSSHTGREVLAHLEALRKTASAEELKTSLEKQVLPKLKDLHQSAVSGRFSRIEPWVREIVAGLEDALQGRTETAPTTELKLPVTKSAVDLTSVLPSLAKTPSIQPKSPEDLRRTAGGALTSTSDVASQLLVSLKPELKPILYKAWQNVPVTNPPAFEAHAFKVRASIFGHNAPLEQIKKDGVVVDTKEWDLQLPGTGTIERFEIVVGREAPTGTADGPPLEISFAANIKIGDKSTGFVALKEGANTIDFRTAGERVEVTLTHTPADGRNTFVFRFAKRPIELRIVLSGQEFLSASLVRQNTAITLQAPTVSPNKDISVPGVLRISGISSSTEDPKIAWLDAPYEQILPGSWVAMEKPSSLFDPMTGLPRDSTLLVTSVTDVSERSRAVYGLAQKSTRLRLENEWLDTTPGKESFETIRGTGVFAGSERLTLAEEPIETAVSGNELELDGLYDGLESGRWLIVTGERADVTAGPTQDDSAAKVPGVPATEFVMLAAVEQRFDPDLDGDKTHTYLRLAKDLAFSYKRDTVIVYGNVVNSTHGETRNEVLGSGNAAQSLQEFTLKQSPLTFVAAPNPDGVDSTLKVRVNDVLWHESDSLAGLGPNDYRYVTRTDDEGKTSVIFGTGEHGARLPTGPDNVTAVYRNGIGKAGNVRPDQITMLTTRPLGVKGVTNPMAATGGADRESRDLAKQNAPLAVMALDRLVSTQDYADFARTFAGIGKASAARLSDGQRRLVHLTVAGSDDIPIDETSDLYRNLSKALRDFGDPQQAIEVALREFLLLVIEARVSVLSDYLFEKVEPNIRAAILDRFSFERRELGQDALVSEVMATIQNVKGVAYVDIDKFDWIDEKKVVDHLGGGKSLGETIGRSERIPVALARVNSDEPPGRRIKPAQLAYFSPTIPDTIILSEITS